MIPANAKKAVLGLLRKPTPTLVADLKSLIDKMMAGKAESTPDSAVLLRIGDFVGRAGNRSSQLPSIMAEWRELRELPASELPPDIVDAGLFAGLAKHVAASDWLAWLSGDPSDPELRAVFELKLLKAPVAIKWAKQSPDRFYNSVLLDLVVQGGTPLPRSLWKRVSIGTPRRDGLMRPAELIAESYSWDKARDASVWLFDVMIGEPAFGAEVIRELLREPRAARQFASECALIGISRRGSPIKPRQQDLQRLISMLRDVAVDAAASGRASAPVAKAVLEIFAVMTNGLQDAMLVDTRSALLEVIGNQSREQMTTALLALESSAEANRPNSLLCISAQGAHAAVADYLSRVGAGVGEGESGIRALEHAQFSARRRLVLDLIPLTSGDLSSEQMRVHLDAALQNLGVEQFGTIGEQVTFDPHSHDITVGTAVPGELVSVHAPGWALRIGQSRFVIQPALATGITS